MQKIAFNPAKAVISVWHNHQIFNKIDYKNTSIPKKPVLNGNFAGEVLSWVENGKLWVSKRKTEQSDFQKHNPLVIDYFAREETHDFFNKVLFAPSFFTVFRDGDTFWLRLVTADPVFHGYPLRKGYDLCPLPLHAPVRILINSKTWHSFSGRRASQYYECDYVYQFLGTFPECYTNEQPQLQVQNLENIKTIDLRKKLY
jgi:hypothetical protein